MSESKYSEADEKRGVKLSKSDIQMIEDTLNRGLRVEIYPSRKDTFTMAAVKREQIK